MEGPPSLRVGLFSRDAGANRCEGTSSEGSGPDSLTSGVEGEVSSIKSTRPANVSRSVETRPVGSEFRLGDEGEGDETPPGVLNDAVNKLAAACDCCASNLELFRTSLALRFSGDSGVPGAEGMGLIRVRFELDGVFLVYRLAVRVIAGFDIPLLSVPLVCAALSGVPEVPTDEEGIGGTPGVPMLAENKGLKAFGVSGNVWRSASVVVGDPSATLSKESRLSRTTVMGWGRDGSEGADGINMKSRISGEDTPDELGFDAAGLPSSVDRRDSLDLRENGDEGTCRERGRSLPIGRRLDREELLCLRLGTFESAKARLMSRILSPFRDRLLAVVGVWGKDMELLVSVLWDFGPPDHGDNDGVDGSGDSCKCTGKLDFNGEPNR